MGAQLRKLILGLYYPAIVGTAFILILFRLTQHSSLFSILSDLALYYGLIFLVLFSGCFLAIDQLKPEEYSGRLFFVDLFEATLVFLAFYFLGLFDTNNIQPPNVESIYIVIALAIIFQQVWSLMNESDSRSKSLLWLRVIALVVLAVGYKYYSSQVWVNIAVLIGMYAAVIYYLYSFRSNRGNSSDAKKTSRQIFDFITKVKIKYVAQVIAVGELIVALPLHGIYLAPIRFFGDEGYWEPMSILTNILRVVFIMLPFLTLYGVSKDLKIGYWCLGLFPIVAFVLGVTAVPFVKYFYGSDEMLNSFIIGILNIMVVIMAFWLYKTSKLRSNKRFN